jgi:hypothetical protein
MSCFAVLKRSYGSAVQEQMRAGINHVDKDDFLDLYLQARTVTYQPSTIQSGFRATGLVPFNPDEVLLRLHIELRTPSPIRPVIKSSSAWVPETLHNITELDLQTKAI